MRRFTIVGAKANFVSIAYFNAVEAISKNIVFAMTQGEVYTTSLNIHAAQTTLQVSALPLGFAIFTGMVIILTITSHIFVFLEHLTVFQHAYIIPSIVYFTSKGQAGTQSRI